MFKIHFCNWTGSSKIISGKVEMGRLENAQSILLCVQLARQDI